jgi:hypothetical protein
LTTPITQVLRTSLRSPPTTRLGIGHRTMSVPPSTETIWPVMNFAPSEL